MEVNGSINQRQSENPSFFAYLRCLDQAGSRRRVRLAPDRVYTVGRKRRRCEIVVESRLVSKRHCQLFLDGVDRRLRLVDGFCFWKSCGLDNIRGRFRAGGGRLESRVSSNGVFVNGKRVERGTVVELSAGDEILLGCCRRVGNRCSRIFRYGFVVDRIEDQLFDSMSKRGCGDPRESVNKALALLRRCRSVLQSVDPVSRLRSVGNSNSIGVSEFENFDRNGPRVNENEVEKDCVSPSGIPEENKFDLYDSDINRIDKGDSYSNGNTFFLNRLEHMAAGLPDEPRTVTLPELLHPVKSLVRVFMATFTSDVPWFLSYCQLPKQLPVTIACHNAQRCWSSGLDSRTSAPYVGYPNLLLVYPPFPEVIAFGKDRKRRGVACHHPKLIVLQRKDSMRVILTSANLTPKQWNYVTNTVWWQDFPSRSSPEYSTLFASVEDSPCDFATQLGGFIASLVSDVPSQAHWISELTKYDFRGAAGHLVASIPGMHAKQCCPSGIGPLVFAKQIRHSEETTRKYVGSVQVAVVGLSHRFHSSADSNGACLKAVASFLGKFRERACATVEVLLKRSFNIPADSNAMSVFVTDTDENSGDTVQLGFLPREVAKWVSPLSDMGFFSFSAFIYPKETLTVLLDRSNTKVPLLLLVSQGPNFDGISRLIQPEHLAPLSSLMASIQRSVGLWRLQEVLAQYKWPESLETDFLYGASSIGTSVNPQFIAAFSQAAGKRSVQLSESEESDPEWGCWTAKHESRNPSIKILFPTIERVKNGCQGIQPFRFLLSLPEKTWQKLKPAGIFHDAVPHPANRQGYPTHVKVAWRRFESQRGNTLPFGWVYCGSHNFSPAAWGQNILPSSGSNIFGPRLHVCNYEIGIILVFPPSDASTESNRNNRNIDDVVLPFIVPAPRYQHSDRPATAQAMRDALAEATVLQREMAMQSVTAEEMDEDMLVEGEEEMVDGFEDLAEEKEEEKIYAEMLWSQLDSSGS